jgi:plasmid maintenance system antidote protein VapI
MEVKFTLRMIAAYMEMSIEELAKKADIDVFHLQAVSAKRIKMTADDLVKLSRVSGIPTDDIVY